MSRMEEPDDREAARRRSMDAANDWDGIRVTGRGYVAIALTAATLIGASMVWSLFPILPALLDGDVPSGDRFQFWFAFASLIGGPALGWWLWYGRRHAFAIGAIVVFGLSVGALMPLTRG